MTVEEIEKQIRMDIKYLRLVEIILLEKLDRVCLTFFGHKKDSSSFWTLTQTDSFKEVVGDSDRFIGIYFNMLRGYK